jgi:hypothetical protein
MQSLLIKNMNKIIISQILILLFLTVSKKQKVLRIKVGDKMIEPTLEPDTFNAFLLR